MVDKPEVDKREYRHFVLENGMKALVVHDPDCVTGGNKAAAALCLSVGRVHEPKNVPGIAHFCEHMLFLGSKKYPDEAEYKVFAKKNGGMTNAATGDVYTCYKFQLNANKLEPMLDRFAQFFISPLFTKSATEREINAVNAEHEMRLTEDGRRLGAALLLDVNPGHPLHWGSGNIKTLKTDVEAQGLETHAELLKFYEKSYSSNQMSVCVVGGESLEELEEMVKQKFLPVPNKNLVLHYGEDLEKHSEQPAFKKGAFTGKMLYAPFKEAKSIKFDILLPWQTPKWRTKAGSFFSHFIGHEGKGSVLSLLKKEKLASSLSAYCSSYTGCFSILSINVTVPTDDCVDPAAVERIGSIVFAYIGLIRDLVFSDSQDLKTYWEEERVLRDVKFRYKDSAMAYNLATDLAQQMQFTDPADLDHILSISSRFFDFDQDCMKELIEYLTPENLRLTLVHKKFAESCTREDPWYNGKSFREPIENDLISAWNAASTTAIIGLSLPKQNIYIPKDLSLRTHDLDEAFLRQHLDSESDVKDFELISKTRPVKMKTDNAISNCFWRPDYRFRQPKTTIAFKFYLPFVPESPKSFQRTSMWCKCTEEELKEETYDASLSGLYFSLSPHLNGFTLTLSGFNDKIPVLLATILAKIEDLSKRNFSEEVFEAVYELSVDKLRNLANKQKPYYLAHQQMSILMSKPAYIPSEHLNVLGTLDKSDIDSLNSVLFDGCFFESLCTGNMAVDEYSECVQQVTDHFKKYSSNTPTIPVVSELKLSEGVTMVKVFEGLDPAEANICTRTMIQLPNTLENVCMGQVLAQSYSAKYFKSLRTEQQLGYIVASAFSEYNSFCYLLCYIQSQHPTEYVFRKSEQFFSGFFENFVPSDEFEKDFESYKDTIIAKLKTQPRSVRMLFNRDWDQISGRTYDFDIRQKQIETIDLMTIDDLRTWVQKIVLDAPKLMVEVKSLKDTEVKDKIREKLTAADLAPLPSHKTVSSAEERTHFREESNWESINKQKAISANLSSSL